MMQSRNRFLTGSLAILLMGSLLCVTSPAAGVSPITITSIGDLAVVPSNWYHPVVEWDDRDSTGGAYQLSVWAEKERLSISVAGTFHYFEDSSFIPFLRYREVYFTVVRTTGGALISSDTVRVTVDTVRFTDDIVCRLVEPLFNEVQDGVLETAAVENSAPEPWGKAHKTCIGCHAYGDGCAVFNVRRGSRRQLLIATASDNGDVFQNSTIGEFSFVALNRSGSHIAVVTGAKSMIDRKTTFDEPFDMTYHAGDISVFEVHSGRLAPLPGASAAAFVEDVPAWSSDGTSLLYCRYSPNPDKNRLRPVTIMQIPYNEGKGGEAVALLKKQPSEYCYFPKYSPDGDFISFVSGDASKGYFARTISSIWLYRINDARLQRMKLNVQGTMNSWHVWSSDGRWMVFASKRGKSRITAAYCARIGADGTDHPAFRVSLNRNQKVNLPYLIPAGSLSSAATSFGEIVESLFRY